MFGLWKGPQAVGVWFVGRTSGCRCLVCGKVLGQGSPQFDSVSGRSASNGI